MKIGFPQLTAESWWRDLGFLADLCEHLNFLNEGLQGRNQVVTQLRDKIKAFVLKLNLYSRQLAEGNLKFFPNLSLFCDSLNSEDSTRYIELLANLAEEFKNRFEDLDKIFDDLQLFSSPLTINAMREDIPAELASELISLQCDSALENIHKTCGTDIGLFWRAVVQKAEYPLLTNQAAKVYAMFSTTYVCEAMFSLMKMLKSKARNCLSDEHLVASLRIKTADKLKVNFDELITENRCQISLQKR